MGVKPCDRYGCNHVMCDRVILDNTMYICDDCFAELLEWKENWNYDEVRACNVRGMLDAFMNSRPGTFTLTTDPETVDEVFKRLIGE